MRLESAVVTCALACLATGVPVTSAKAQSPSSTESAEPAEAEHRFLEPKKGKGATFYTPGGELTIYGRLDVSLDATTKGIADKTDEGGNVPPGNMGWMPALSTNLSYFGARGFQRLGGGLRFVWQLETQLDIAASSGLSNSNSNQSQVVKGGLTSRNTYIGLGGAWGALKLGKTDAPYKSSTQRMNPFSGMIGDYSIVMGNTGGDNRVEFGTRLDHSIWYESPKMGGLVFAVLFSPGQNRSGNSDQIPAGEPECAGGNIPGSGGTGAAPFPIACNDGGFGNAFSAALAYEGGPLYVTGAYERHRAVNRNSDIYGIFGAFPLPDVAAGLDQADVADEDAWKVAAQVKLPTGTTVGAIFEDFHRYTPSVLDFQNERQRTGAWVVLSQQFGASSIHLGWAHAFKAVGDPGQHNTSVNDIGGALTGFAAGGKGVDNSSNMLTAALKHDLGASVVAYVTWAGTFNHRFAHYDLGAGGRAVTTDCHDGGLPASGDIFGNPHCWAGGHLMGVSAGLSSTF